MPRIWLDCSSLGSWNLKHLTGIQRTVLGICKGFRHHGREPILFSFDEVDHYFRRIDLQELPDLIRLNMESSEWISMEQELAKETIGPVTAELRQPNPGLFPPSQKDRLKRRVLGEDATAEDLRRSISACKLSLWHLQSSGRSWLAARRLRRNQLLIDAAPEAAPECSVKENDIRRELQPGDLICCFGSENYQMEEAISASKHLRQAGGKVVRIIYDMIPATQPQWINEKVCHDFCSSIRKAIETADLLLTISTYSQLDLQRFASDSGISLPPVQTIRLGDDVVHERKRIPKEPIQAERPQRPFFLCIGTVEPRKNHQLLYAAWRRMAELSSETCPDLVCIGVHNIMSSQVIRELSQDKLVRERIYLLQEVGDQQVEWYYRNCLGTVFPSLYEGWGLPVAESLAHGKICLASNASSIPEISDLIQFFNPHDPVGLIALIMRTVQDSAWRDDTEAMIRATFRMTRWSDTAEQVLNLLETL